MKNRELIIKIDNQRVYFSHDYSVSIHDTNIPVRYLMFNVRRDIFWKVRMEQYIADEKILVLKVLDYESVIHDSFHDQKPKKEINKIVFDKFDWDKIETQLSFYQKSELTRHLREIESNQTSRNAGNSNKKQVRKPKDRFEKSSDNSNESFEVQELKIQFWVAFNDAQIGMGKVFFNKYIKETSSELYFEIINDHLLPEFEGIKFWFAKKMKLKRFMVESIIVVSDGKAVVKSASSKHLAQISEEFIQGVKLGRVISVTRKPVFVEPDKSLFTADEMFGFIHDEGDVGNVFKQSDAELIHTLLNQRKVRNAKQIAFLAGKMQDDKVSVRYTLTPHFGFLFYVEGEANHHFIWELLNSHATYMWSLSKGNAGIEELIRKVEKSIAEIRNTGRDYYKSSYLRLINDSSMTFSLIRHEHAGSKLIDDFPRWKSRLTSRLD
ncbi:MAG: hypothetical protein U0V49_06170 [Saprospiraceae bacterium]